MARPDLGTSASLTRPLLIGRDEDLAALLPHLASALQGNGTCVVLVGEGGVGKSRLAQAVGEEALRAGFRLARGRAFPVESGVPYALFADAFMPLVQSLDAATLATLARGSEAELALVLPATGAPRQRPQAEDPAELRTRVLWTFTEFVRSLAARQPLLLLLDDLHWADVSSLEALHFLARQVTNARVLILATFNDSERGARPELRTFEQSLLGGGVAHVRVVRPLSREDTDALVRSALDVDDAAAREFSVRLYAWTRGNPFFLRETLRSLVESGALRRLEDGRWVGWDLPELALPGSVREVITSRLDRLGPDARAVADAAAVIGTRFDHELLHAVVTLSQNQLLTGIDELRRGHVVLESSDGGLIRYDFAHPMLRQALYEELGTARARALHGYVAEALEQLHGAHANERADELAFHFARAEPRAMAPKAVRYLHAAGSAALDRFADREAVGYLRLARDRWTQASAVAREVLEHDLARAHLRLGEHDAAIELWRAALPAVVTAANAGSTAAIHRRLGQAHYWAGRFERALEHYQTGIHVLTDCSDSPAAAALHLAAGVCLQELGRAEDAARAIETARAIAESLEDPTLLARAHRALLLLHVWTGPPDVARAHGARAVALARAAGDPVTEFFSVWGLAVLEGLTGHTRAMAEHVAVIEQIAEARRSPLLKLWTAELAIEHAGALGDWARGITIGDQAIRLARALNQRMLLPRLLVWTSLIHIGRRDMAQATRYIDEAWSISGADAEHGSTFDVHAVVPAHIGRAALHLANRDFAEAIRVCERGLAIADRTGYAFWAMHRLLPILAEAHCHLWDVEGALTVERRIRHDAERLGHAAGLAWADGCRALAVWIGGDPAGAIRLMRGACEALEAIPMLPDAARLRRQLAGRLAETGDRDGALQELRRVHEMFARMGAEDELDKARGMFREIGAKPPARSAPSGAEGLTSREVEIARMVAARKSNKAIGKALDISPRTVGTHLSNIYRKLGVASRGELADYVRVQGVG